MREIMHTFLLAYICYNTVIIGYTLNQILEELKRK